MDDKQNTNRQSKVWATVEQALKQALIPSRLSQKQITWTIRIGVALAVGLLILVLATWVGVVPSDNAAVVGALLALIGVLITQAVNSRLAQEAREHQQEIENERAQDDALQEYLNQISDPKTYKPLRKAAKQGYRRAVMRAKLKTLLLRLNGERKGILLLFLHEAKLIKREEELLKRKMEEKLLEKEGERSYSKG